MNYLLLNRKFCLLFYLFFFKLLYSQLSLNNFIDYENVQKYCVKGINVDGVNYFSSDLVVNIAGIKLYDTIDIPGEKITNAIKKIWNQGLFSEISIEVDKIIDNDIYLIYKLKERPRLSKYKFFGISKGEADDLKDKLKLFRGSQVTDHSIRFASYVISKHFKEKGFYDVKVDVDVLTDTTMPNYVILHFNVFKGKKHKIKKITFVSDKVFNNKIEIHGVNKKFLIFNQKTKRINLLRAMKNTKEKKFFRIFKASKFIEDKYEEDKKNVIEKLNEYGFRDAEIVRDTIVKVGDNLLDIKIWLNLGDVYYFRNINWIGNTIYSKDTLEKFLGIKKGDLYNQKLLENRLINDMNSVLSLYQDNGYLFSYINVIETNVENDSVDIEISIYEGKKAKINYVNIIGNTKTHERVIRREMHSRPGDLYSRNNIIRTIRELASLNYFDPEKLDVKQNPNVAESTVDLDFIVEEKPSDQLELSGGWGGRMVVGTVGIALNNFSIKDFFKKDAWKPIPSGAGQRLTIRAQTNGLYYTAITTSFIEPWFGGKKPNTFSISAFYTLQSNGIPKNDPARQSMTILGTSIGLGHRLKFPDDYFSLFYDLSYQRYYLNNYKFGYIFTFSDGVSNNVSLRLTFQRNSIDQPIYPRRGSLFVISLQATPPYSLLSKKDYSMLSSKEKYKWIEYHKWNFSTSFFSPIINNFVINLKLEFGFLAMYNKNYGFSPFESFYVGGDGLMTYNLYGRETVPVRGYGNGSLTPLKGGNIYNKFTFELRYPLSLNPSATFYLLAFFEGGNSFYDFTEFVPFAFKRSAGVGVRIFLPMFGKLGVDWGYGFDEPVIPGENKSQFHFIIGQNF